MSRVIGIDLGTTNSCVAVLENGRPIVIANDQGHRTTPSVVAYTPEGELLVGDIARRQAATHPELTITSIKRFIGRQFSEVEEERARAAFKVVAGIRGDCRVEVHGKTLSPSEISAQILMKLRRSAEEYLQETVTDAVITVPAYFNDAQRQATKTAGRIAGLEVKRIVNEPTAAALAYGLQKKSTGKIAVYDFGGGTFDISILDVHDDVVRVLATNGDTHLGGDDIDHLIVRWLVEEFRSESGIDLAEDRMALERLKSAAEKFKIELSATTTREINLPFLAADASGPKHLVREVTRARLEAMIEDLVQRTLAPTWTCLSDAGLLPSDISQVVLVGGSTRIPRIQAAVRTLFGREASKSVNPDEAVALGAAIQAGVLTGEVKDLLLLDVTPLSLGIETSDGLTVRLIDRNTAIPMRRSRRFTTAADGITGIDFHVVQGERDLAKHNRTLGRFTLEGLPPVAKGVPQIDVTFDIDASGLVTVSAKDEALGTSSQIRITNSTGLKRSEVEQMIQNARDHEAEDKARRQKTNARDNAQDLVRRADEFLTEHRDKLGHWADHVRTAAANLSVALKDEKGEQLERASEQLRQQLFAAGEALYQRRSGTEQDWVG